MAASPRPLEHIGPPQLPVGRVDSQCRLYRLLPYPRRLKLAFALLRFYQRTGLQRMLRLFLPKRLREMDAMLPAIPELQA